MNFIVTYALAVVMFKFCWLLLILFKAHRSDGTFINMGFKREKKEKKTRKWNRSTSERTGENRKLATETPLGTDNAKRGGIRNIYIHTYMWLYMYVRLACTSWCTYKPIKYYWNTRVYSYMSQSLFKVFAFFFNTDGNVDVSGRAEI